MSGSSSTTSTRNAASASARRAAEAGSLIRDLHLRQEIGVTGNQRFERRPVAAARAVLHFLADVGDLRKAVGVADTLHAVSQLAQLVEVGGGERDAQRVEFLLAVAHEHRDQIFEVLGDGYEVTFCLHLRSHYRGRPP